MASNLKPCPDSPNCVSSLAASEEHAVAPLHYEGDRAQARSRLLQAVQALPRVKIVEARGDYIHVTATSLMFRFVDDVEFEFDDENKLIHVRSASRTGYSDFGVNRKRVEAIRQRFEALK
ncbi:MAG TPA: DUF1499 domain-containing protein [Gammaproteobacteria bacterium]|nr:DUF1499 domain-containing protein [Gammaproteobacteria bacterium]